MKHNIIEDLISLLYPNYCLGCHISLVRGEQYLCTNCVHDLPKTNYHLAKENPLKIKFYGKIQMEYVISYLKFIKSGHVQKLLHHLKYLNKPEIGQVIGRWYGKELEQAGYKDYFDLIVPIPLHKSKQKKRGYNQSDGFAKGLSEVLGIPWNGRDLKRVNNSETQTRKSRVQRWENVANIFEVTNTSSFEGMRILVVDDVITTGSTLESCALSLLNQANVKSVSACTIAVAE